MYNEKFLIITFVDNDLRNIGPRSIYASAKINNIDAKLLHINMLTSIDEKQLCQFIRDTEVSVIGISVMTHTFKLAVEITQVIQKSLPQVFIFWGGVHPTVEPMECLDHVSCICMGEGEIADIEIVKNYHDINKLSNIEGVGIRLADGSTHLNQAAFIEDINTLPFPYYEFNQSQYIFDECGIRVLSLDDYIKYSKHNGDGYTLLTTRSCPNNCSYCINSFYNQLYKDRNNRFIRRRSVENVIQEIEYAMKTIPTIEFINFMDDHFFTGESWLENFIKEYKARIHLPFIIRSTPEALTSDRVNKLKPIGLQVVQMGIQSGCAETHKNIFHRHFNREKIIEATNLIHDNNLTGMYDFIIGNEFETNEQKKLTLELMLEIPKPYLANLFHIIPFPKTDIIKFYETNKITPRLNPYNTSYLEFEESDYYSKLAALIPKLDTAHSRKLLNTIDEHNTHIEIDNLISQTKS